LFDRQLLVDFRIILDTTTRHETEYETKTKHELLHLKHLLVRCAGRWGQGNSKTGECVSFFSRKLGTARVLRGQVARAAQGS
jgi:hypothetical protein